jgi:6-methylsalicylate decarboxylase
VVGAAVYTGAGARDSRGDGAAPGRLDRAARLAPTSSRGIRTERAAVVRMPQGRTSREEVMSLLFGGCACCAPNRASTLTRRNLLAGGAAMLGAGALAAAGMKAAAQGTPQRIDVHHHISPPTWLDAVKKADLGNPPLNNWSVQKSLDDMDQGGTATAICSPTTPQLNFLAGDPETAARLARESNEYTKKLMSDHPGRFGLFAMLPLPHVDASLKEIAYAFDALKADGVGIMTSYGDKWLGYPQFAPVWEELNRRKATVYTHPTGANCCVNLVQGIGEATVEFGADTTRTIASLIFSGTSQRFKDINWIFSHGGGVLTAVAERLQMQMVSRPPYKDKFTRAIVDGELARFYYDTAQVPNAVTIGALAKLVPISQIVYGTDYPYRTGMEHAKGLAAAFAGAELLAIERANALRILPRLKAA